MKKIIINLIIILISLVIILFTVLSTIGIQTNKFNKIISNKVSETKNINLELDTIIFKLDPKEFSLFLQTQNPKIKYNGLLIPVKNIKVYIDFLSLLKSDIKIIKTNIILNNLNIPELKKLSSIIKPSNFKSLINNKIKEGELISQIEIFLNEKGSLENFIAKGKIINLKAELISNLNLNKTSLSFFADKNDILIKNIFGNLEDIKISEGDIKINLENGIKIESNFDANINLNKKSIVKYDKIFHRYENTKQIKFLQANLNNNISIKFDKTYKVQDYNYSISGKVEKAELELSNSIKNSFLTEAIKNIYFSDLQIQTILTPIDISLIGDGKYSLNNLDFSKINLVNNFKKDLVNLKLNLDFRNNFEIETINYKKSKNSIANLYLHLEKKKNNIRIIELNIKEGDSSIKVNELNFKKNKFSSLKKIEVKTKTNDFSIKNEKNYIIKGTKFDASNLFKSISKSNNPNIFQKFNSLIEIDFQNIKVPMSEKIQNFKLIGEVKNGKFIKISSKGGFGGNNFLDISMKKDRNSDKKYLEIYSDLPKPLLSEYSFFRGLSGGKLLFMSTIDGSKTISKLSIEKFKVINAPGVIKLLSLADLGGLVDLAEGEGLSFDLLEIDMEKNNDTLKLNEILALGPSISVLMEGYQNKELTSLRGTLVPAKTLNKMISKIPVIGNIVIPKEVGEGLFGISFKMKGPEGQIKTTINPIRTLTPRFIQKIIEKNKQTK